MLKIRIMIVAFLSAFGWGIFRAASQAVTDPADNAALSMGGQITPSDLEYFPEQISSVDEAKSTRMVQIGSDALPLSAPKGSAEDVGTEPFQTPGSEASAPCEIDGEYLAIIASLGWHGMDFSDDCRILQWIATGQGDAQRELVRRRIAGEPPIPLNELNSQEAAADLAEETQNAPAERPMGK